MNSEDIIKGFAQKNNSDPTSREKFTITESGDENEFIVEISYNENNGIAIKESDGGERNRERAYNKLLEVIFKNALDYKPDFFRG